MAEWKNEKLNGFLDLFILFLSPSIYDYYFYYFKDTCDSFIVCIIHILFFCRFNVKEGEE